MKPNKINKDKYYAATRIIINGWFPWIKSPMTFMSMMKEIDDGKRKDIYHAIKRIAGEQERYYIKGETILDIIKLSEEGKLEI